MTKTQMAFRELNDLLKTITADKRITLEEIEQLMRWRSTWATVVKRPQLKAFTEWFDNAVADGQFTTAEISDLFVWCEEIASQAGEDEMIENRRTAPASDWRRDPVTDAQFSYLVNLGVPEPEIRQMTKGEASQRINQLVDQPSPRQLRFLGELGVPPEHVSGWTKSECSKLIDRLIQEKNARETSKAGGCLAMVIVFASLGILSYAYHTGSHTSPVHVEATTAGFQAQLARYP